jgi:hypothetical protein
MVTDPPWGVNYGPTWRDNAGGQFGNGKTKMRGKVANDDRVDWCDAWALFPGDVAYAWCASIHNDEVISSIEISGFVRRSQIIWVKSHFILSRGDYHWMAQSWNGIPSHTRRSRRMGARRPRDPVPDAGHSPARRASDCSI